MVKILTLFASALLSATAWAGTYKVVDVTDGDTVKVISQANRKVTCRLHGIDAPETEKEAGKNRIATPGQAFGEESHQSLQRLVYGRTVEINIVDQDRYGRSVCRIFANGIDVNREQIARGMAWMYRDFTNDPSYDKAENAAKAKRLGVWSQSKPVAPWDFRRAQRNQKEGKGAWFR